ncbi:glycosyltransferase [Paralimibaculum aggregatum]|uniref:Glycosyltransferase n=1 Tax=Paralimibaculum aggregatum TaxID=3036245 RepID=A0ABQ6LPJ2_9RHOB|nr:glycosyltransferase [Limibaculum sp. NKW23]GMG82808.1 glycosyltransferase [Limibaculum sp. NKW23]
MNLQAPPGGWRLLGAAPARHRLREREPSRPRLGAILAAQHRLRPADLASALALQRLRPDRLGATLVANGWAAEADVAAALATQRGLGLVDLDAAPPDRALLDPEAAADYLQRGVIPWRRKGRVTTYAAVDPDALGPALARIGPRRGLVCIAVCTRSALERAVAAALAPELAARAAARCPEAASLRGIRGLRRRVAAAVLGVAALVWLGGEVGAMLGLLLLFLLNAATGALRIGAMLAGRCQPPPARDLPEGTVALSARRPLPRVSLLVPLYREAGMVGEIVAALSRLDYPRAALEVRLLLEADDAETIAAVAAHRLPAWIRPLVVPAGRPRTKPRALNYALDFCTGEIVGILDAEDRPEPGQLRDVAATLAAAAPEIGCVQCQLSYHNARENWLSRCFQIEYSIWFDVLLRGFQALGLPIPLGGTSVYFRRSVLQAVGGWDAHNVTEDADLGMRLARRGLKVAVLGSVTEEEANCVAWRWVRQRSRWLKGYLLTWLSHMRAPGRLWRELGPLGFAGLNLLFLGAATAYLAIPLFWAAMAGWALTGQGLWQSALPGWALWPVMVSLAIGQAVMLGCAGLALRRRGQLGLLWVVPTLPVYWTLGAVAAWKAVAELIVAPFWWDKTRHGTSRALGAAPPASAAAPAAGAAGAAGAGGGGHRENVSATGWKPRRIAQ